jgi:Ca2+-transporting ATPase
MNPPYQTAWHQIDAPAAAQKLATDPSTGLAESEAQRRLAQYGRNELAGTGARNPWLILWDQLKALMVVILIIAAVVSALLADYNDAIAIGAIVVLNALLGFSQEYRAEKAMAALQKLAVPSVKARREGRVRELPAFELVPGDVVLLEAGNFVPADCRVLESAGLQTQESALTGESEPIRKITEALADASLAVSDRRNMTYMGTFITAGRGQAIVVETGMRTELGRIATMMQTVGHEPTPLQRRLAQLGKGLAAVALVLVAIIFALGLARGEGLKLMFLTAVSIAVAAVPEGLPAVVTIALTLGAHRMLKRNALIRKLPAVETLGSVTVICSDKTGTLTQNRMTAAVLRTPDHELDLLTSDGTKQCTDAHPEFALLLSGGALCNDSIIEASPNDPSGFSAIGDPTEAALATAAARFGLMKSELESVLPRTGEVPFTSERKRMTTVHRLPAEPSAIPAGLTRIFKIRPPGISRSRKERWTDCWRSPIVYGPANEVNRSAVNGASGCLRSTMISRRKASVFWVLPFGRWTPLRAERIWPSKSTSRSPAWWASSTRRVPKRLRRWLSARLPESAPS